MNKIKIGQILYILSAVFLIASSALFLLEKGQIINLYSRPIKVSPQNGSRPVNDIDYSPATPMDNIDSDQNKSEGIKTNDKVTPPSVTEPIDIVFTAATQDDPGGPLVIRILLTNVSKGQCDLSLEKNGITKSYTTEIVYAGNYYNCDALDVPITDLSVGLWHLTVRVTSDQRSGTASQDVEIRE